MSRSLSQISSAAPSVQPTGKHAHPSERLLLVRGEEVVRPGDGSAERLLARIGIAVARQDVETPTEPLEELLGREGGQCGLRPVQAPAAGCRAARRTVAPLRSRKVGFTARARA